MANLHETVKYHTPPGKKIPFYEPNPRVEIVAMPAIFATVVKEKSE